jgi:hypothetical protein
MKLSRRALAQLALAASAQTQAGAQTAPAADPLDQARKDVEANAALLRKREIPMSTEPAFLFKA